MAVRGGSMESLPSDIVQDIVSRVPAESVLDCKLVCKRWETIIHADNFANMHLRRQLNHLHCGDDANHNLDASAEPCLFFACLTDDPEVYKTLLFQGGQLSDKMSNDKIYTYKENLERIYHPPLHQERMCNHLVGSCNGLVCAFRHHNSILDPVYIFNPLTREYVYLPELVIKSEDVGPDCCIRRTKEGEIDMFNRMACGFGYVRSTNLYKVVRIHYLEYDVGNVEVYTLGSGCGWRAVGRVPYKMNAGTYLNDAIYWTSYNKVVAFDLAKEEFRLLCVPPCMQNRKNTDRCRLVVLGKHLCLYMNRSRMEIWSLMKNKHSKETWCMEFDIDYKAVVGPREWNFRPILLTKNGEIVFLYDASVLYAYDTKTTFLKMISDEASTDYLEKVEAITHVNTFASLEAIGEPSKIYTVRPRRGCIPWDDVDDVTDQLDRVAVCEDIDTTRFRLK